MNHQFIDIETPEYIIKWLGLDRENDNNIYGKNGHTRICKNCGFTLWDELEDGCDLFFFNCEEVYITYYDYEELCNFVKLTCDEFIIKNIIE